MSLAGVLAILAESGRRARLALGESLPLATAAVVVISAGRSTLPIARFDAEPRCGGYRMPLACAETPIQTT